MNLPTWKEAVELVGLLAIFLGLFFVYKEIEIIETIARAQLSADTNNNLFELDQMAFSKELASTFTKANEDPEGLTATERWQLNLFLAQVLEQYDRECYYEEIDIFQECESVPRATALRYFGSRYGRAFWKTARNRMIEPRISAIIDDELAKNPADDIAMQIDKSVLENLAAQ
jgi:hypothetical protein